MSDVSKPVVGTAEFNELRSQERRRKKHNLNVALELADAGLAVFPASSHTKKPLIRGFNFLDDAMSAEQRAKLVAEFRQEHGHEPVHIGATRHREVIRKLWGNYPGAVPAIACGPSGLIVIDADEKHGGPQKLRAFFEPHGGIPKLAPVTRTQGGGLHVYLRNDSQLGCRAGSLKKQQGCDVKGAGGYVIAPGAWREDGKRYAPDEAHASLLAASKGNALPIVPDFVRNAIGAAPERDDNVTHLKQREVVQMLREADWSEHESDFDPQLGKYDLEQLKASSPKFAKLLDDPPEGDCSDNRFNATRALLAEWPGMPAVALGVFLRDWKGAGTYVDERPAQGEFDDRQIAREWLKHQRFYSNGDAFSPVDDEEDQPEVAQCSQSGKPARFVFIEDIRGASLRLLDWCIKYFVARDTTSIVSGQWGAGKTAVFVDIALHIAHGISYRGRKVRKGVCVYVALENPDDVERRVQTWCEVMAKGGHDVSGGAFVVHRGPCRLFDPSGNATRDEKELIKIAKQASEHYGLPVAMVIVDTLSQALSPGDEHKDGAKFTGALQRIANATGGNVTALHHPTKAGVDVRGDGAFQGNVDTIVVVSRDSAGRGSITAGSKFRIGDPSKVRFSYRLKSFTIGRDDDGDDIEVVLAVEPEASAALTEVSDDEDDAVLVPPDGPSEKLEATLRALKECAAEIAAATGEQPEEIGVQKGEVFKRLNRDRKAAGLAVLKDPTMVTRLLDKLVKSGQVVKTGENRRTEYQTSNQDF